MYFAMCSQKDFFPEGPKVVKFHFTHSKLRTFLLNISWESVKFQIHGAASTPLLTLHREYKASKMKLSI